MNVLSFDPLSLKSISGSTSISISSITQLSYIIFWLIFCLIAHINRDALDVIFIIKTLFSSAIFVSLWGAMQFTFSLLNIGYPSFLFNNSTNPLILGYRQTIGETGISRISSVAAEPSLLAQFVVPFASFATLFYLGKSNFISKRMMEVAILLSLSCAVLSTSSTAYVGLLIVLLGFLIHVIKTVLGSASVSVRQLFYGIVIAAGGVVASAAAFYNWDIVYQFTLGKSSTASYVVRTATLDNAMQAFRDRPLVGGSVGPVFAYSLPVWLLGSLGVLGALSFAALMVSAYVSGRISRNPYAPAFAAGLLTALLMSSFAGFSFQYGLSWMYLTLLFLCTSRSRDSGNEEDEMNLNAR